MFIAEWHCLSLREPPSDQATNQGIDQVFIALQEPRPTFLMQVEIRKKLSDIIDFAAQSVSQLKQILDYFLRALPR